MKKKKIIKRAAAAALLFCTGFVLLGLYNGLCVKEYNIDAENIETPVKIALIADLHSCRYGEGESRLVNKIDKQKPDLVVMTGDIFDDELPDDNTACFIEKVAKKYPCYYVTGNHEFWSGREAFQKKMQILQENGVVRLKDSAESVTVNGEVINLCGVDDPDACGVYSTPAFETRVKQVKELADNGNYTVLLTHRPEQMELYADAGFELVLCGHAHGGQWRIPFLINGLYAPNQGKFPQYAGGKYTQKDTTMIVSRGLAKECTFIPRFYNRPEVVIVSLT